MEIWGRKVGAATALLGLATIALLLTAIGPVNASTLQSSPGNGTGTSGQPTGNNLFSYFLPGISTLTVIDPNGCGNSGVPNANCRSETDACVMIYGFDANQEMLVCCGCPITPNELFTIDVVSDIPGVTIMVSSAINDGGPTPGSCGNPSNPACNGGCDPTVPPITSGNTNLVGSITHLQTIGTKTGLTEVPLSDQGRGDAVDNAYLVSECGSLVGNNSARATCTCP